MSKPKYYFRGNDAEYCYTLDKHLADAKSEGLKSIELYEAIHTKVPDMFYCKKFSEVGERGMCGKSCDAYKPKNSKSGCCKHYSNGFYEPSDKSEMFEV